MKIKILILTSCFPLALTGCTQVKSQDYYAENIDKAKEVLQKCETEVRNGKNLEGKFKENCTNASMAVMNGMMNDLTKDLLN